MSEWEVWQIDFASTAGSGGGGGSGEDKEKRPAGGWACCLGKYFNRLQALDPDLPDRDLLQRDYFHPP